MLLAVEHSLGNIAVVGAIVVGHDPELAAAIIIAVKRNRYLIKNRGCDFITRGDIGPSVD